MCDKVILNSFRIFLQKIHDKESKPFIILVLPCYDKKYVYVRIPSLETFIYFNCENILCKYPVGKIVENSKSLNY